MYIRVAGGELIATDDTTETHYYLNDWLGTRRVQTDYEGMVEQTCASLPYGDGETCTSTPTENLFTGKERDAESGNDYFGARYYGSSMGRFLSPDWSNTPEAVPYADLTNPQSLNLYSYVDNNPLSRRDLDGHCWGWIQGVCNFLQKVGDKIAGNGWNTFAQVRANHRQFVMDQQKTDSERNAVKNATDAQIKSMYRYYTDPVYNA